MTLYERQIPINDIGNLQTKYDFNFIPHIQGMPLIASIFLNNIL